jgi:hypothetical protein
MLTLKLRKPDPCDSSRFTVEGGRLLHLRSRYSLSVAARDFVGSGEEGATLSLHARDDSTLAAAVLAPDPMRRDVRIGTLDLSDPDVVARFIALRNCSYAGLGSAIPRMVDVRLIVTLGGDTVVSGEIAVEFIPSAASPGENPPEDTDTVDADGSFYLPVFKRNGIQVYRRLTEYVDEHGPALQVSPDYYVKSADGVFTVLPEVANG